METKKFILGIVALSGFIALMGIVGSYDYAEQVIYNMPDSAYKEVVKRVGKEASSITIANEYMDNKEFYDKYR